MKTDFLEEDELATLGLASCGRDVRISRHALLLSPERIWIGDHTRVDAFSILSASEAGIRLGRYVHISAYAAILGRDRVDVGDLSTISIRATVLTSNGDYTGQHLGVATIPEHLRAGSVAPVKIGRFVTIGTGSIVLPGIEVGDSATVGALSMVRENVPPYVVVGGIPARPIKTRRAEHVAEGERLLAEDAAEAFAEAGSDGA
jgi:dTDP-4-amino-4,6-dideoxy-D-glucose acyltransferase